MATINTPTGELFSTKPLKDFTTATTLATSNYLVGLIDTATNQGLKITVGDALLSLISSDAGNTIQVGADGKLLEKSGLTVYSSTTSYGADVWVLDNQKIYNSLQDNNLGNPTSDTDYWEEVELGGGGSGGASRNIGEVVTSTIPLTDAGLHLLDGTVIQGSGIYSAFVNYIASIYDASASYFCTEAEWQQSVTDYGVCGKFVYDGVNNTVRLPLVTGKLDGTTDVNALGDLEPLMVKLPNITGSISGDSASSGVFKTASGCITSTGSANAALGGAAGYGSGFSLDASRSSSVYSGNGSDTTIHEQAINVLYYIVVATATKTDIQVDIDEIATDLNMKVDKSQLVEAHVVVETYQNGTSWYRVYDDGWCEQGGEGNPSKTTTVSVVFLKPFLDNNYTLTLGTNYGRDTGHYLPGFRSKTATGFVFSGASSSTSADANWCQYVAFGYIA